MAVGGFVVAWANREAKQAAVIDKLSARVDAGEKDIKILKETHDQRLNEIQNDLHAMRIEQKSDVKALWDRTEERHNRIEAKVDRLLERGK